MFFTDAKALYRVWEKRFTANLPRGFMLIVFPEISEFEIELLIYNSLFTISYQCAIHIVNG